MVQPYEEDVVQLALENENFRKVLVTGENSQIVVMSIPVGEEIGEEVHEDRDQTLAFVSGTGEALVGSMRRTVEPNSLVFVPAGTRHNFINRGDSALKLITVYAPPEHPDGTVHRTKAEADAAEAAEHAAQR